MFEAFFNYFKKPNKNFIEIMTEKGGYCFVPFINEQDIFKPNLDFFAENGNDSIIDEQWPTGLGELCKAPFRYSGKSQATKLHEEILKIGTKVCEVFEVGDSPLTCHIRNTYSPKGSEYYWHYDKTHCKNVEHNQNWLVFSLELLGGKGTCFKNGDSIVSPKAGEAAIFLAKDDKNSIAGTEHSAPISVANDQGDIVDDKRILFIMEIPVEKEKLTTPEFLNWIQNIDTNNRAQALPYITDNAAQKTLSYDGLIAGLVVGEILKPGIKCINDKIDAKNEDSYCYEHYQETITNQLSIPSMTKAVISEATFAASLYSGNSLFNSLMLRKLSSDISGSILKDGGPGKMSQLSLSEYSQDVLTYASKGCLSILINSFLFPDVQGGDETKNIFVKTVLTNIVPSLIDLSWSLINHGVNVRGDVFTPNEDWIDI